VYRQYIYKPRVFLTVGWFVVRALYAAYSRFGVRVRVPHIFTAWSKAVFAVPTVRDRWVVLVAAWSGWSCSLDIPNYRNEAAAARLYRY